MDNWDQEAVDLVQPGFIEFDDDGLGGLGFIAVTGELDWREADRDGRPGLEFSWQGSDEGDDVSGRGWTASSRMAGPKLIGTSHLDRMRRDLMRVLSDPASGQLPPVPWYHALVEG